MKKLYLLVSILFFAVAAYATHGGSIKGIVVSSDDSEILPGVLVRMQSPNLVTSTNEIGTFYFTDIPNGEYNIEIRIFPESLLCFMENKIIT